jgi:hypothetical protein
MDNLDDLRELVDLRSHLNDLINMVHLFWFWHLVIFALFLFSREPTFLTLVVNLIISLFLFNTKTHFKRLHAQVSMKAQMMVFENKKELP